MKSPKKDPTTNIEQLVKVRDLAIKLRSAGSLKAVVNDKTGTFRTYRRQLEVFLNAKLFKKTGTTLTLEDSTTDIRDQLISLVTDMDIARKRIANLASKRRCIRIGCPLSAQAYFVPAVIERHSVEQGEDVDLGFFDSSGEDLISMLHRGELDFAIYFTGIPDCERMRISTIPLNYKLPPHGIVFLYGSSDGIEPFPALVKWVNDRNGTLESLFKAVEGIPLILINEQIGGVFRGMETGVVEALCAKNSKGKRYYVSSFRHERILIQRGLGVGFSGKPSSASMLDARTRPDGTKVLIGHDFDFPSHQLSYVDVASHKDMGSKSGDFSVYVRKDWQSKGGLSADAKKVLKLIQQVCDSPKSTHGYLDFDPNDGKLVHNFTYTGYNAPVRPGDHT